MLQDIIPVYKLERVGQEGQITDQGLAGRLSVGDEELYCAPLFFPCVLFLSLPATFTFITLTIIHFLSIFKLLLSQPMSYTFFPILVPIPWWVGKGAQRNRMTGCMVFSCWQGLNSDAYA